MVAQLTAILFAQWKAFWNFRPAEGRIGRILGILMGLIWYGMWAMVALGAWFGAGILERSRLEAAIPWSLMAVFFYWQLSPILSATLGATIDTKKLLLYPIPTGRLFTMELLLRAFACLEMLLVLTGGTLGLLRNPVVPRWGPLVAIPSFVVFNLFVAAGIRNLLERLLAYKRVREVLIFCFVLAAALPQLLAYFGLPRSVRRYFLASPWPLWPWSAAGHIALNDRALLFLLLLAVWTVFAYLFGAAQFRRSLSFDFAAQSAAGRGSKPSPVAEFLFRAPRFILGDPLAAIVEKELRSLTRTPRFRLVFLMGFSFGVLIWWPLFHTGPGRSASGGSYPVLISVYALVLLAEAIIWNVFGFDRAAAQLYYSAPIPFSRVLAGKNIAALVFVLLEISMVLLVCVLLRLPMPAERIVEAYLVTLVLCLYLEAAGNLSSLYFPRPVNPEHTWGRRSGGNVALLLMLSYPMLGLPVLLAYGARYAFESQAAFYGVLAFSAACGIAVYLVSMDSALAAAERRKERLLAALTESPGPLVTE